MNKKYTNLGKLSKLIRYYILLMTTTAGSGHATSSLSAVELMVSLLFGGIFKADLDDPKNPVNDRLIFSKGHASPLFYALYAAAGKLTEKDLLTYRKFDSNLEGHPTLRFPYTEAPTGSLGQGLSIGLGMALAAKNLTELPYKTYVLMGDGEMAEGSVWEAASSAAYYKADNLVAILDVNRLGQSQETMYGWNTEVYRKKFEAFGWSTVVVDGYDYDDILEGFKSAGKGKNKDKPLIIIAKTVKGKGISLLENKDGWHGKPLPKDLYEKAVAELSPVDKTVRGTVLIPEKSKLPVKKFSKSSGKKPEYKTGDSVSTRQAAGDALTELMYKYPEVVVLDGDVKNSLYTETTQKEHPGRYFEMYIAEQNMTGTAIGMWRRGFVPFVTTFSAFMSRTYDQIRMANLAGANIKFLGSHAGVSIGEDGASQMGLEDISMFRSILGSTVLYPGDAVAARALMNLAVSQKGIVYVRVGRPNTPVLYNADEKFTVGGSKAHLTKSGLKAKAVVAAVGITLLEALKAQEELEKEGIGIVVVDCYSVKPLDGKTLKLLAEKTGTVITVEDHWFEGGLGDEVLNLFADNPKVKIYKLAVSKEPRSGKPAELLEYEGISSAGIIRKIKAVS